MTRPAIAVLALSSLLFAPPAAAAAPGEPDWDAPAPGWRHGPVRYLLTREETRLFKKLDSNEARAGFIRAFWERRDPTPETRRNEFREQFYRRVEKSESLRVYFSSSKPMWLTDPGRIYVLLGPPTSQQSNLMGGSERDRVDWSYQGTGDHPGGRLAFAFVADETGELRLSDAPELDQATIQGLSSHSPAHLFLTPAQQAAPAPGRGSGGGSSGGGEGGGEGGGGGNKRPVSRHSGEGYPAASGSPGPASSRSLLLGGLNNFYAAQRLPQELGGFPGMLVGYTGTLTADMAGNPGAAGAATGTTSLDRAASQGVTGFRMDPETDAEVRATPSFEPLPMQVRTDFYRADDGTTYAAFTLAPGEADRSGLVPFGGIISIDDPAVTYSLSRVDQFAAAGPDAPQTFQTGLGIDPGRYRVLFGLQEPRSGRVGTWEREIEVPDLRSSPLELSSLTLARSLEPSGMEAAADVKVPFVFGNLRVVPRTEPTLHNGDQFHLYYQIYGAEHGADGLPALDAVYRFQGRTGDRWVDLGDPIEQPALTGEAQAWSFPVQGWPAGEFRLLVEVKDRHSGRSAGDLLEFHVEG